MITIVALNLFTRGLFIGLIDGFVKKDPDFQMYF